MQINTHPRSLFFLDICTLKQNNPIHIGWRHISLWGEASAACKPPLFVEGVEVKKRLLNAGANTKNGNAKTKRVLLALLLSSASESLISFPP